MSRYLLSHLSLRDGPRALVLQRQKEADGHEQLVHAAAELFLILSPRRQREESPRLDNILENVLCRLGNQQNITLKCRAHHKRRLIKHS